DLLWVPAYESMVAGYSEGGTMPVASFNAPASEVTGLAYYGQYLHVGCTNGYVYRVHCPGTVSVAPASLGKVKTLYY
ncbi:MAG TPA: hypothetical protein VMW93_01160, partial [bacterium]|nr:hypothetical protein [bacterium]